jgi:hypothetical protein
MSEAPKRRWSIRRMLSAMFLSRALKREWHPDELGTVSEFQAIRRRKAELDEKLFGKPRRRWRWWHGTKP